MIYGTRNNPADVSTLFIFVFLMLGLIMSPFFWCARSVGLMDPVVEPDCHLRTQELCDQLRKDMERHPEGWD